MAVFPIVHFTLVSDTSLLTKLMDQKQDGIHICTPAPSTVPLSQWSLKPWGTGVSGCVQL